VKRLAWVLGALGAAALLVWLASRDAEQGSSNGTAATDLDAAASAPPTTPSSASLASELPAPEVGVVAQLLPADPSSMNTGDSVSGLIVRLSDDSPLRCTVFALVVDDRMHEHAVVANQRTDENGHFAFGADVAAHDPLWLQLSWGQTDSYDGPRGRALLSDEVLLPPRAERTTVRLILDTGWIARGRVVTPDGAPVPDAHVASTGSWSSADADGRFVLRDLDPKPDAVTLSVLCSGHSRGQVVVSPPRSSLVKEIGDVTIGPVLPPLPGRPQR
jgi:hypothetical protein